MIPGKGGEWVKTCGRPLSSLAGVGPENRSIQATFDHVPEFTV